MSDVKILVKPNGPLLVSGEITLATAQRVLRFWAVQRAAGKDATQFQSEMPR